MLQIIVVWYNMKQMRTNKARLNRLIANFHLLSEKDQIYLESLASQLAEIQKAAPETQGLPTTRRQGRSGKDNKTK